VVASCFQAASRPRCRDTPSNPRFGRSSSCWSSWKNTLGRTARSATGSGMAYARKDGEKMWEIDLPSPPLRDGLDIAADGRVVVALRNGALLCVSAAGESAR
jgi:hypothetical protein